MRHNKQAAPLVAKFAEKTCRSLRSAQWHRQRDTPAWRKFNDISEESPPTQPPQPAQAQPRPKAPQPMASTAGGIAGELERIQGELIVLAARLTEATDKRDLATELSLHRALDGKREILRKLRLAHPEIRREDGESVPVKTVFDYVVKIHLHLTALPKRIAGFLPPDAADESRRRIAAEINAVLDEAAKIDLDL